MNAMLSVRKVYDAFQHGQIMLNTEFARVFFVEVPTSEELATEDQRKWFILAAVTGALVTEVKSIKAMGDNYYALNGGIGISGDSELFVTTEAVPA